MRALAGAADRTDYRAPATLRATLRPYQHTGFNWLAYLYEHRLGGVLADDMGLGKTLQALALMCHTKERGLTDDPWLVVAPTSVVGNWASECRRFAPRSERDHGHRDRAPPRDEPAGHGGRVRRGDHFLQPVPDGVRRVCRRRLGRAVPRRGPVRQEPALPDLPAGQDAARPVQGGDEWDADREQSDGAVVVALHRRTRAFRQSRPLRRVLPGADRKGDRPRAIGPAAATSAPPHAAAHQRAGGQRPAGQAGAGARARPQPQTQEGVSNVPAA